MSICELSEFVITAEKERELEGRVGRGVQEQQADQLHGADEACGEPPLPHLQPTHHGSELVRGLRHCFWQDAPAG